MSEEKHPEAGRLRIRNTDGRTYSTVVEMADGAGGWTKVRGVIAVSWEVPRADGFTKAVLQIEAPMVDLEMPPYAVEQQVVQSARLSPAEVEEFRRTWEQQVLHHGGVVKSATLSPAEVEEFRKTWRRISEIAPLSDPREPPVSGLRFTAEMRCGIERGRFEIDVTSRHEQRRLEMLVALSRRGAMANPHQVEELPPFSKERFPLRNGVLRRDHEVVIVLPKLLPEDAAALLFMAKDPGSDARIAFARERADAGLPAPTGKVIRRVDPTELVIHRGSPDSERPKTRGRAGWHVHIAPYGAALAGLQAQQICLFDPPETQRELDWFLEVARQRLVPGGKVVNRWGTVIPEGTQLLPPDRSTYIPQQPAPVPIVMGVDVGLRPDQVAIVAVGKDGEIRDAALICGLAAAERPLSDQVVAGEISLNDARAALRLGPLMAGEIRTECPAVGTIPASALRPAEVVSAAAVQSTEVGFGDPDPAPPTPEPQRDAKLFDDALARALQKHRSL